MAISLVLFEHFVGRSITGAGGLVEVLQKVRPLGGSGVDLFFVLSGFLIGGILMDNRDAENYFKSFYVRRCCRILPPYFLTVAACLVLRLLLAAHSSEGWFRALFLQGSMPAWAYLTFTQNIVKAATWHVNADCLIATWSLAVEEQFYVALPLAIWLLRPSRVATMCVMLIVFNPLLQLFLCIFHPLASEAVANVFPIPGDALWVGVVCAYLVRRNGFQCWSEQNKRSLKVILIVLMTGTVYIIPLMARASMEYERILFFSLWVALFYAAWLLVSVSNQSGIVATAMRFTPLRRLGRISYGVYLFHMPVNGLLHGLLLGRDYKYREPLDVLVSMVSLALTLLLATVSWHFFEKPIVKWGHSFLYDKPANSTAA